MYALADLVVGIDVPRVCRARLATWASSSCLRSLLGLTGGTWFLGNLAGLPGITGRAGGRGDVPSPGSPGLHLVLTMPNGRPRSRDRPRSRASLGTPLRVVPDLARSEVVALTDGCWTRRRDVARAPLDRSTRVPVTLMAVALAGPALARLAALRRRHQAPTLLGYDACLVALAAVLTTRLLGSPSVDVADLVVGLSVAPSQSLRDALARAVGDPTLQVAFVAGDGYVDAHGSPVELDHTDGRALTPLLRDGPARSASSPTTRLSWPTRCWWTRWPPPRPSPRPTPASRQIWSGRSAEVRASRRRLVTAGIEEGRRLEADLSHGPGCAPRAHRRPARIRFPTAVSAARRHRRRPATRST